MITIKDVAKRAGVSIASVSRVLNRKGRYTSEVEAKVRAAAAELGYAANLTARSLKTGLCKSIGMVAPDYYLLHYPALINSALRVAQRLGFDFKTFCGLSLRDCIFLLQEKKVDGLLITEPGKDETALKDLINGGLEVVLLGGDIEREDVNLVEIDYFQGGYIATQHLVSLGHREILFIEDNERLFFTQEIKRGYLCSLDENGIQYREELLLKGTHMRDAASESSSEASGYAAVRAALKNVKFSAVLATDDALAYGALSAVRGPGHRKARTAVVGFGNFSASAYLNEPLTTVDIPVSQMGELGAEILVNNIERKDPIVKRVKLKVQLIQRATASKKAN